MVNILSHLQILKKFKIYYKGHAMNFIDKIKKVSKTELILWVSGWTVETLLVKYWVGVESWLVSVILALTLGSLVLKGLQHAPDLFVRLLD